MNDPDLEELIALFHESLGDVGVFREAMADDLPLEYQTLLAHDHHMTVAMEEFHHAEVNLEVLQERQFGHEYAREIILRRATDGVPVQYGIVRLHWDRLPQAVRLPIERQAAPLGRILIEQQVLRQVRLTKLWRVTPSTWLQNVLEQRTRSEVFGRTALILCGASPAIELLEIAS